MPTAAGTTRGRSGGNRSACARKWRAGGPPRPRSSRHPYAHQREKDVGIEWFADVVAGTGIQTTVTIVGHRFGGKSDDRKLRPLHVFSDLSNGLQAVHLRHHDVHEDEVG